MQPPELIPINPEDEYESQLPWNPNPYPPEPPIPIGEPGGEPGGSPQEPPFPPRRGFENLFRIKSPKSDGAFLLSCFSCC